MGETINDTLCRFWNRWWGEGVHWTGKVLEVCRWQGKQNQKHSESSSSYTPAHSIHRPTLPLELLTTDYVHFLWSEVKSYHNIPYNGYLGSRIGSLTHYGHFKLTVSVTLNMRDKNSPSSIRSCGHVSNNSRVPVTDLINAILVLNNSHVSTQKL